MLPQEEEILAPPLLATPEIEYQTITAKHATIEDKILSSGVFINPNQYSLKFRFRSGPLRAINVRYGDQVSKGQLLAELDNDRLQLEVAQQKILLRKTQIAQERSIATREDRFTIEMATLDIQLTKIKLNQLEEELEKSQLFAPIDGQVVYISPLNQGDTVEAFRTIIQIADPTEILLSYNGSNKSEFRLGVTLTVILPVTRTRDEQINLEGEVVMTPLNVPRDAPEEMKELILIRVNNLPAEIKRGDNASIELIKNRRENVIVLPRNLVQTYLGRRFVYILKDGLRQERNVKTGIQTPTQAEIIDGITVGEKVIVR